MLPQEHLACEPDAFLGALGAFLLEPNLKESLQNRTWVNQRRQSSDRWRVQRQGVAFWMEKILSYSRINPDTILGPKTISLTPELQGRILNRYRSSNQTLAEILGINLAMHGYC